MRVGAAPISWGACEVPGWGVVLPWRLVLEQMEAAGYEGTELGPPDYLPTDPDALGGALRERHLDLASAFVTLRFTEPERVDDDLLAALRTARLLRDLGATCMVVADAGSERRFQIAGDVQPEDGLNEAQWDDLAETLHRLARAMADSGMRLAFHGHAGTYIETRAELDRLCEMTHPGEIGLCLDTGHLAFGGADPVDVTQAYAARITHLHLKDVRLGALQEVRIRHAGFRDAVTRGVFCELGDGDVDLHAVQRSLAAARYSGWLIVEQDVRLPALDGVEVRLLQRARDNREAVREIFGV